MKKYNEKHTGRLATHVRSKAKSNARPTGSISRAGVHLLNVHIASSWLARFNGLFACGSLGCDDALLISPCTAVHTVGLKFTIDVVFINKAGQILKCTRVRPFSVAVCWNAHSVLEMSSSTADRLDLSVGQHLVLEEQC